jgi:tetraacyldisaccharide 4'-kinase
LIKNDVTVFVMDDGFQRRQLHRDLDILLIDLSADAQQSRLLPLGHLRESPISIQRADVVVLSRWNQVNTCHASFALDIRKYFDGPIVKCLHNPTKLLDLEFQRIGDHTELASQKVLALCSIARPTSFVQTIEQCGARVSGQLFYRDHHEYVKKDIQQIVDKSRAGHFNAIITTLKDAVKLKTFRKDLDKANCPLYVLVIQLSVAESKEALLEAIDHCWMD